MLNDSHKELNQWAELCGIRNQFHWWDTEKTKRRLIMDSINKAYTREDADKWEEVEWVK